MNKSKKVLLILTAITILAVLGFIVFTQETIPLTIFDLVIFGLIILVAGFAITEAVKKNKEEQKGYPSDDEFSDLIKYKSGYYAFLASMYIWLFIFLFRSKFPDFETAFGGGILLSTVVFLLIKYFIKKKLNEK